MTTWGQLPDFRPAGPPRWARSRSRILPLVAAPLLAIDGGGGMNVGALGMGAWAAGTAALARVVGIKPDECCGFCDGRVVRRGTKPDPALPTVGKTSGTAGGGGTTAVGVATMANS